MDSLPIHGEYKKNSSLGVTETSLISHLGLKIKAVVYIKTRSK